MSDVIYFAHALDVYRTLPMCVCVPAEKSEEATASSASLLASWSVYCVYNNADSVTHNDTAAR